MCAGYFPGKPNRCLVVVAHPDDEAIWMGGTILLHPDWQWNILSLCRADDPDRAPRFERAAREFRAVGQISDLDDSPILAQLSPDMREVKERIRALTPGKFDLIFTHGPRGEYSRHPRHEQVSRAVREMVESGELLGTLVMFAYDDCVGTCRPRPTATANVCVELAEDTFDAKRRIVKEIYGFPEGSFEFEAAGSVEGFLVCSDGQTIEDLREALSSTASEDA